MPLATTLKVNETKKIKELLSTIQSETELNTDELERLSDSAIDFILYQASLEPENRRILSIPPKEKNGISFPG